MKNYNLVDQILIHYLHFHPNCFFFLSRLRKLETKAKAYKIYEEYLQGVIDAMPEGNILNNMHA